VRKIGKCIYIYIGLKGLRNKAHAEMGLSGSDMACDGENEGKRLFFFPAGFLFIN
jgi:hypothetical protein